LDKQIGCTIDGGWRKDHAVCPDLIIGEAEVRDAPGFESDGSHYAKAKACTAYYVVEIFLVVRGVRRQREVSTRGSADPHSQQVVDCNGMHAIDGRAATSKHIAYHAYGIGIRMTWLHERGAAQTK
jgi:hypothetical protein